jgi:acetyl esterase/lipase
VAGLVLVSCGSDTSVVSTRDVEYVEAHLLDVYAPADADRLPVVVLLHGAGVDRRDYEPFAERLAEAGALALNVDWDVPPTSVEGASEQIACAVRFSRTRAAEFGGDPNRVVLVGHSSAAPWATRAALVGDEYEGACASEEHVLPDALALLAPSSVPGGWPWEHSLLALRPELDVAVVHGIDDTVASTSVGRRTAEQLSDAGHEVSLEIVPGGHFDLVMIPALTGGAAEPDVEAADRAIEAILELAGEQAS